ncbi:MAG: hypothetical protein JXQ83_01060, partial [Candidatus Glassbacteria bacterium]|nr:hypothetical protein [Candidatus Glassbacteria bacterium]
PDDIQAVSLVEPDRLSEQGAKIIEGYYLNSEARMEVRRSLIRYPFELMVEQDGVKKLYDLEQDPLELADLSRAEPEIVERMADELKRTIEALEPLKITPKVGARRMSKELEKQLKALGYIK